MADYLLRFSSGLDRSAQASQSDAMSQEFDRNCCGERQMSLALMTEYSSSIGEVDSALHRLDFLLKPFD